MVTSQKSPREKAADRVLQRKRPPPSVRGGRSAALTDTQRQFAAKNHNLIYRFLIQEGWDQDEYYDIAALGFLRAARRYDMEAKLKRYAFSTVAWPAMRQSIACYHRAEARRRESEKRYAELHRKVLPDPFEEAEYNLILHDLVRTVDDRQYEMAALRLQGYSIAEIASRRGLSAYRVRKLLQELFRVYLTLYGS